MNWDIYLPSLSIFANLATVMIIYLDVDPVLGEHGSKAAQWVLGLMIVTGLLIPIVSGLAALYTGQ